MTDVLVLLFATAGTLLMVIASLGVLVMPDFFHRVHPPTKAATLGMFFLLAAVAIDVPHPSTITKALLAVLFLALTAPAALHLLCRAAYRQRLPLARPLVRDDYAAAAPDRSRPKGPDPDSPPGP